MKGRDETAEGLDKRIALSYYARWKFINDLMPLLRKTKDGGEDAKVLSVLAAGKGRVIDLDDLGLKNGYSVSTAVVTAATYNDLMIEVSSPISSIVRRQASIKLAFLSRLRLSSQTWPSRTSTRDLSARLF